MQAALDAKDAELAAALASDANRRSPSDSPPRASPVPAHDPAAAARHRSAWALAPERDSGRVPAACLKFKL